MSPRGTERSRNWWRRLPGVAFCVYAIVASAYLALTTERDVFWILVAVLTVFLGIAVQRRRSRPPGDRPAHGDVWETPLPRWGDWARVTFALAGAVVGLLWLAGMSAGLLSLELPEPLRRATALAAAIGWSLLLVSGLVWLLAELRSGYRHDDAATGTEGSRTE